MKTITICVIIGFMFLSPIGLIFAADDTAQKPEAAPLNPDFLRYIEASRKGQHRFFTGDGHPLGYIPSPVDLSHVKGVVDSRVLTSYPSGYDLRDENRVTPIRNQGQCGSCWTFATYASLESYLMPSEPWDFSEQHLNANHGFDYLECEGGNAWMSTAYMARWDGPLRESDVPYPYSFPGQPGYSPSRHIQQVVFLPERTTYTDNDTIKYHVTQYGAVMFSFKFSSEHYNKKNWSYYYNYNPNSEKNSAKGYGWHAVAIVGWNDNYSKYNYNITPPGNGAFIAKNSWGYNWGQNGYFYISYYDKSLGDFVTFNNAEPNSNYERIYQYDPLGWVKSYGYTNSKTAWGANIFTAADTKPIRAISFYTTDSNVEYNIYIYKGVSSGKPRSGTLAAEKSGSKSYPGYYTVKLDSSVSLKKGERFSVVIKFKNSNYNYPVAVEEPDYDYSSSANANQGESYMSKTGSGSWSDMAQGSYNRNVCIKAFTGGYSPGGNPKISCSRGKMNFGSIIGGSTTNAQTFTINNSGTGTLSWTLSGDAGWLKFSPTSGTNSGVVTISINASGLSSGSYTAYLSVIDSYASNSPQKVTINLTVKNSWQAQVPFGEFATPTDGSTVRSSIPVTGWVLDDIGVTSVKIYNGNSYIGDALFVEGARPDVEQAYPTYPMNYKAGWGYMLLTNFLPNGGNGRYIIHAKATDREGHVVNLASKTIYCDNAHAVKPFGAIDTPVPGGAASGKSSRNWGWVLTPQPNKIPTSGSTINVYVDGVMIGHPQYNLYRSDINALFPGYANSNGAAGYFDFDTTSYANGVHTIQWTARDSAGNTDGIGSRYFMIDNTKSNRASVNGLPGYQEKNPGLDSNNHMGIYHWVSEISGIPGDYTGIFKFKRGYNEDEGFEAGEPDEREIVKIVIREDELLRIYFDDKMNETLDENNAETKRYDILEYDNGLINYEFSGYQVIGERLKPLPIGSAIDSRMGIFYWQPGPGFIGEYEIVFIFKDFLGIMSKRSINIKIIPKL
jgi:C1A family cysteine protease